MSVTPDQLHQTLYGGYIQIVNSRYWCRICAHWFETIDKARSHCLTTKKHEWCKTCERVFVSKSALEAHHREAAVHQHLCSDCKRTFATVEALKMHYEYSSAHNICFFCADWPDFHTVFALDQHLSRIHFYCFDCSVTQPSQSAWDLHQVSEHHGCDVCFRTFFSDGARQNHMKSHEARGYKCRACKRTFTHFSHLLLHLERSTCGAYNNVKLCALELSVHGNFYDARESQPWFCKTCARLFESPSGLFAHCHDSQSACAEMLGRFGCLGVLKAHLLRRF